MAKVAWPRNAAKHVKFFVWGNPYADETGFHDKNNPAVLLEADPQHPRAESKRMAYAKRTTFITGSVLTAALATVGGAVQYGYLQGFAAAAKAVLPTVFASTSLAPAALALFAAAGVFLAATLITLTVLALVSKSQAAKLDTTYRDRALVNPVRPARYTPVR